MLQKLMKIVLPLLALIISPLILGAVASVIFLAVQLINGESLAAAVQALTSVFQNLQPFLPYITGIPAVLIIVTVLFTNRNRIQSRFRK